MERTYSKAQKVIFLTVGINAMLFISISLFAQTSDSCLILHWDKPAYPDTVKIDTCHDSPTAFEIYAKRWFGISLPMNPTNLSLTSSGPIYRFTYEAIADSYPEIKKELKSLEARHGSFVIQNGGPEYDSTMIEGDEFTRDGRILLFEFLEFQLQDSVLKHLTEIAQLYDVYETAFFFARQGVSSVNNLPEQYSRVYGSKDHIEILNEEFALGETLRVIDNSGKIIAQQVIESLPVFVDISQLPSGCFIVACKQAYLKIFIR